MAVAVLAVEAWGERWNEGAPDGSGTSRSGAAGGGGLLNGAEVSHDLAVALTSDASDYRWVAATIGAQNAASYQLATNLPVMAVGGFNGIGSLPDTGAVPGLRRRGENPRLHRWRDERATPRWE
ncbi:hypothetical protein [Propioniciclava flava]